MPRRRAANNMFEPVPVRTSRRVAAKATAKRTEANLLQFIGTIRTMEELDALRVQMASEMIPMTAAVRKALEEQEEEIARQDEDVPTPEELAKQRMRLRREMRMLGVKPRKSGLLFGPRTRKSRGRRAMDARAEADLQAALEAEERRIEAANAAAAAAAAAAAVPVAAAAAAPLAAAFNPMNALAGRFAGMSLGERAAPNGLNPWNRENAYPIGVPGYHREENWGGEEEEEYRGGRRKIRKTSGTRRKGRGRSRR